MESPQYIRAQLVNYTNADCSDDRVENNRYHYHLKFEQDIGWDWLHGQIKKASHEFGVSIEMWKIRPSGLQSFEVEVREVQPRKEIDDDQIGLTEFESTK